MRVEPFVLERFQSVWENRVRHNLAESGVHPLTVDELLTPEDREELLGTRLLYAPTNGSEALRAAVAALYPAAAVDNVVITHGAAEANHVCVWRLVEPGDEVLFVLPNYMQAWGLARGYGARAVPVWLREESVWDLDLEELERAFSARTRLVVVCNPNNPTGAVLSPAARAALTTLTARHGAWLLVDEVYRGAEREGEETASFFGAHERVLVTGGLSKAYGLPGLRIGWVAGPRDIVAELWARRDYVTISPGTLSDMLARRALRPDLRRRLLERTRAMILANDAALEEWRRPFDDRLSTVPPRAGAIAFLRYAWDVGSTALCDRLRQEQDVLVVPGDHFGLDRHLRIGLGNETADLRAALDRVGRLLRTL